MDDENKAHEEFDEAFGNATEGKEPEPDDLGEEEEGEQPDDTSDENDGDELPEGFEPDEEEGGPGEQDTADSDEEGEDEGDDNGADEDADADTSETDDEIDYRAEFEAMQQRVKSWEGRLSAAARENAELKRQLEELQAQKQAQQTEGSTDDEDDDTADEPPSGEEIGEAESALAEFYEDFPALKEPLQLLLRQAKEEAVREATGKVKEVVDPIVTAQQRAQEEAAEAAQRAHLAAISEAHPDWEDLASSGKLAEWAQSLPYQEAIDAIRIMQDGETQEVIDLLNRYKQTSGGRQSAGNGNRTRDRRSRQIADAEAVRSRPGGPPRGAPDRDDFDGAFEEAASSMT